MDEEKQPKTSQPAKSNSSGESKVAEEFARKMDAEGDNDEEDDTDIKEVSKQDSLSKAEEDEEGDDKALSEEKPPIPIRARERSAGEILSNWVGELLGMRNHHLRQVGLRILQEYECGNRD